MTYEIKFDFAPVIADKVNKILAPTMTEMQRNELARVTERFNGTYDQLTRLIGFSDEVLIHLQTNYQVAEDISQVAQNVLRKTLDLIPQTREHLPVVRFRFLSSLHNADPTQLTWWLKLIRGVTRPPDSPFDLLNQAASQAQRNAEEAQEELRIQTELADGKLRAEAAIILPSHNRAKNRLVAMWEEQVVFPSDLDLAMQYIAIRPKRMDDVVRLYTQRHPHDKIWQDYFTKFERNLVFRAGRDTATEKYVEREWVGELMRIVKSLLISELKSD